ncbi:hypothetical protein Pmani_029462 [Petrolisthes manimaculis]|uniref:WW domain-containing protein n=1 Tax=Petrolisthes manimaculis TaxID=1843537 RepID=A0AAE1NZN5_9EUCA|nr:hypothetical protein Pmani_029462 [Petrolisthes manimaculis]
MGRKGQEEYEAKLQEEDFLKAMEEAALKAYKADIEKNPDITGTTISEIAKASNAELVVGKKKGEVNKTEDAADSKKKDDHKPKVNVWHEAASPEGQSYYWNVETGESSWEAPAEGYLSLTEQKELKRKKGGSGNKTNNTADNSSGSATKDTKVKKQKSGSKTSAPSIFGPAPKVEAYSTWQTIQREPEKKQVDLQLPKVQQDEYYGPELVFEKPVSSFQEKIVKLKQGAGEGGSVTFKKRKGTQDNSKIMKRRNDL